jgi:hypothetical protein
MSKVRELRDQLEEFGFQEALVGVGVGWNYPAQSRRIMRDV